MRHDGNLKANFRQTPALNFKLFVIFNEQTINAMNIFFLLKKKLIVFFHMSYFFILKALKKNKNSFHVTALANRLQSGIGFNSGVYAINLHLVNAGAKWINTSNFFNKPELINSLESI